MSTHILMTRCHIYILALLVQAQPRSDYSVKLKTADIQQTLSEIMAQLLRAFPPGLCHTERRRFESRPTHYFLTVSFTLHCMHFFSFSFHKNFAQVNSLWRQVEYRKTAIHL